jgi:amino acid adenylation domain-containing protein
MITSTGLWGGPSDAGCVLTAFRNAARHDPDAVALVDGGTSYTYAQLWGWAGGIARLLTELGVHRGDRVAVAGPRSAAVVAAMWAVTGVGAAYVPMDTTYPPKRLAHIFADAGAEVLLTTGDGAPIPGVERTVPVPPVNAVEPDHGWKPVGCEAELPVYVIYTSGSTGVPKGVALPHRSIDNMAWWQRHHSVRPTLRTAQFAPLNFDVWFQEVLGTLGAGGTLVIMPEELRRDALALLDWLARERVERLFLPCVALHMLAVAADGSDLPELVLAEVNVAGEQLVTTPGIRRLFRRLRGCRLNNHYGQSESAMVTVHTLTGPSDDWPALPPIGTPLPGCELLIDDATGELLVAGAPLSTGYLNRAELNAERYLEIPETPRGHRRAFRTGDLVRIEGGAVHYVGRVDDEVKIRGFRVNPLEVDACLAEQPGVVEGVCVPIDVAQGSRQLRAAVTVADGAGVDGRRLRAALRDLLPAHSVPLSVTVVASLPRTPSGKIDRAEVARRLAAPRRPAAGAYDDGDRIDQIVERHAGRTPDRVAVRQGDDCLTYAELWAGARAVAGRLTAAGVRHGDVVPVLLDRSPGLVSILLGVQHAGAAYACLDPAWPAGRIADVLDRTGRRLIVDDATAWLAPDGPPPAVATGTTGGDAACVFFTSGSTGRPKGVVAPHRGLIRAVRAVPGIPAGPETTFLAASPLPWDGFSFELLVPLLNGGTCVLAAPGPGPLDAERFAGHLREGVNSLFLPSSLFTILAEEATDLFAEIRLLVVGGDRMNTSAAARLLGRFPGLRLVNAYGPAENSIVTSVRPVRPEDVADITTDVPIGMPIPHTSVVLLGSDGRPVADGTVGEIVTGGDGMALGYLGDPEETHRRFFTVTDGLLPAGRYYRTGDLASRDAAGQLRYRGRADRQVKLNGIRTEPGEVEAVLEAIPGLTGCAVTVLPDPVRPVLACAYTSVDGRPLDSAAIREAASARLLPAMIPAVLRHVDRLPLGGTGKVDLAAVRALLSTGPMPRSGPADGDPLAAEIAEMLGRPALRSDDDLLDAGLTSLDAVRIAARCTARLGGAVTLADVYIARTVEGLRRRAAGRPIRRVASSDPVVDLPLTHAQRRFLVGEWLHPGGADNQVLEVYRLDGPLDADVLAAAVRRVVDRHIALRTVFPLRDGEPTQHILAPDEVGDLLERRPAGPDPQAFADACRRTGGFALDRRPPVRFVLGGSHLLALHAHHVAIDGRSEQVIIPDLFEAYADVLAGRGPRPKPEPDHRAYAAWEANAPADQREADLAYWRPIVEALPAPLFAARPGEAASRFGIRTINAWTVRQLTRAAARHGGPPVAALAAATGQALRRTFEAPAVALGLVTDGRSDPAFADVVGYLVNPVLLTLTSSGDPVAEAAAGVVSGLQHGVTPYDELLWVLRRPGDRHPWFQALLVLQGHRPGGELAPGLTVTAARTLPQRTGRDWTVQAFPRPDGGWDLVTEARADGIDKATAVLLADELEAATLQIAKGAPA